MKKMIKFWDIVLITLLGLLGSGCILDPVPEYGVEPLYGVPAALQDADPELRSIESQS